MKPSGNRLASIPVRITFGFSFMFYGIPKLFDLQTHRFIVGMLTQIGVPAPDLMTYVVGTVDSWRPGAAAGRFCATRQRGSHPRDACRSVYRPSPAGIQLHAHHRPHR